MFHPLGVIIVGTGLFRSFERPTNMFLYLGTCHQLGGGQGTLGGGSNNPVLKHSVLCNLGHILGLQHQHGGSVGHCFGQVHQDVLQQQQPQVTKMETHKLSHQQHQQQQQQQQPFYNIFISLSSTEETYCGTEQIKVKLLFNTALCSGIMSVVECYCIQIGILYKQNIEQPAHLFLTGKATPFAYLYIITI